MSWTEIWAASFGSKFKLDINTLARPVSLPCMRGGIAAEATWLLDADTFLE